MSTVTLCNSYFPNAFFSEKRKTFLQNPPLGEIQQVLLRALLTGVKKMSSSYSHTLINIEKEKISKWSKM